MRAWLALASVTASLLAWSASCGDRRIRQRTVGAPRPAKYDVETKPNHAAHEHAHGAHPHKPDAHHHHPHPHPHVEAANGHHHPY